MPKILFYISMLPIYAYVYKYKSNLKNKYTIKYEAKKKDIYLSLSNSSYLTNK